MHAAYRPNTGGSTRSYRSYTFGPPGISSSSPVPPPAGAVDPMYDEGVLQLRSRGQKPGTDSYKDQDIGRAL
ncbi:hypothetical protein FRC19_000478 [Serendipita sp. 401]|nr:hypothetical protein FRC19_000478 [Serendipita sp. 401]